MDINNKVYIVVQKYQISASLVIYGIWLLKCTIRGLYKVPSHSGLHTTPRGSV